MSEGKAVPRVCKEAAVGIGHPSRINTMLAQKLNLCDQFLSATLQLQRALVSERMKEVERLLERREGLIRMIQRLDREMNRCWNEGPQGQDSAEIRQGEQFSDALREVFGQMNTANQDCGSIASCKASAFLQEISQLRLEDEALQCYLRPTAQTPKFLNVQT